MRVVRRCRLHHQGGQSKQRQGVRKHHQLVKHIRQLPHQIIRGQGAEEDENQSDDIIYHYRFFTKEIDHIDLAEHVPSEDGGESKEEQADCHEDIAGVGAEHRSESSLRQVRLVDRICQCSLVSAFQNAALGIQGRNDDKRIQG